MENDWSKRKHDSFCRSLPEIIIGIFSCRPLSLFNVCFPSCLSLVYAVCFGCFLQPTCALYCRQQEKEKKRKEGERAPSSLIYSFHSCTSYIARLKEAWLSETPPFQNKLAMEQPVSIPPLLFVSNWTNPTLIMTHKRCLFFCLEIQTR